MKTFLIRPSHGGRKKKQQKTLHMVNDSTSIPSDIAAFPVILPAGAVTHSDTTERELAAKRQTHHR